ncbi:hypothetical protein [Hahella ganghwensis]|uniref:hypothetical protein n=1 Tax=Hahella ganghwensis TaxID=286420 RepID=UPI0003657035|nr:hypothetical protein [Hahella ganghwensis]
MTPEDEGCEEIGLGSGLVRQAIGDTAVEWMAPRSEDSSDQFPAELFRLACEDRRGRNFLRHLIARNLPGDLKEPFAYPVGKEAGSEVNEEEA